MDRFVIAGGVATPPATPDAPPENAYFTAGNPQADIPATVPGPFWFHMITEEIRNVIIGAGLDPDVAELDQLYEAITTLIAASIPGYPPEASETVLGLVEKATAGEAQAFTPNKFIDGERLASAFGGANQSMGANGYQRLPGGLILQWGSTTSTGLVSVTFPIAFPNAAYFAAGSNRSISSTAVATVTNALSLSGATFNISAESTGGNGVVYWFAIGR